ncbi:MAG: twin-arginine translocation signal domain-containing protein, partial [Planctomycetes bacterium]|nr:twin-arginine translocation signal domain-containing protein [Planctomycetota bacterium]
MASETRKPTDSFGALDCLDAIEPVCRGTDRIASRSTAPTETIDRRRFLGGAALAGLAAIAISRLHGIARTRAPDAGLERVGIPPFPKTPDGLTLFTINEFDTAADALTVSLSVPSQNWLRAWFKWGDAPDWSKMTGDVARAHQVGALFGGGTTCSALYPHENGITNAQFMDMATRDPYGRLYKISNAYYHGAIENPAYRRYVLKWATLQ